MPIAIFWSNEGTGCSGFLLRIVPLIVLLWGLTTGPAKAFTFDETMGRAESDTAVQQLEANPTFDLSDTYVFPSSPELVHFLFRHLDVTGSLIRASGTVDLRVERRGDSSYGARTKRTLEGYCYRRNIEAGYARYVGRGTYRQDYVPFPIRGSALVDVRWRPHPTTKKLLLTVQLRVIPASDLVYVIGNVFYPVVRLALFDVINRIVEIGRTFTRMVGNHPRMMLWKLELLNDEHAERWRQFLKRQGKGPLLYVQGG